MPHDFGSSRDRRSAPALGAGIGFHELRQACEISALREDLERLAHETGTLRDGVEQAVETVRDRFAALTAEEMADPMVLAPLLQLAVTTLLDIREQARQLNTQTGPLSDDERPSWLGAADSPRLRQSPAPGWDSPNWAPSDWDGEPDSRDDDRAHDMASTSVRLEYQPPRPAEPPARPSQPALAAPAPPVPPSPLPFAPSAAASPLQPASLSSASARAGEGQASWLASEPAPAPPPSRAATARANGTGGLRPVGGIDWLGPAGR
ncbi:hypothetical protein J2848_000787 [Azospirillum lipoferum]|uniref:Uncharacterized protein n=1 Tax=Azospirillum lipoferum TaxID=193 RepID=A0A5A9GYN4_AZOLI|nr:MULTISPECIES: hypothetical protein [Azospirillum]KAA0598825.1 hypothetical protein FZ942_07095 [Azospirillum lipoferum]MCP1609140.1 hypothetical protein [Azospirillum lipoferum]MDW5535550.1 hypothetical protein [Azospirillum sp. NL1]